MTANIVRNSANATIVKKPLNLFVAFLGILALVTPQYARGAAADVGTTGAAFLKMGAGARPAALGGAFTGLANDADALMWNPAGIGGMKYGEVSASYALWFSDLRYSVVGGVWPMGGQAVGVHVAMLGMGDLVGYTVDGSGNPVETSSFTARDFSVGIGYGLSLLKDGRQELLVGLGGKFVSSALADISGTALAADAGALWRLQNGNVAFGAAIRNIGTALQYPSSSVKLPMVISAGLSVKGSEDTTLIADLEIPSDHAMKIGGGAEWVIERTLALRGGYSTSLDGLEYTGMAGWSAGIGIRFQLIKLDYALVPYGTLGYTHRVSLGWLFGQDPLSEPASKPAQKNTTKPRR